MQEWIRWIIGGVSTIALALSLSMGGWAYAQGSDLSSLKKEVAGIQRTLKRIDGNVAANEKEIRRNQREIGDIGGDIKAIKKDIGYMSDGLKDIKGMLKDLAKGQR